MSVLAYLLMLAALLTGAPTIPYVVDSAGITHEHCVSIPFEAAYSASPDVPVVCSDGASFGDWSGIPTPDPGYGDW